MSRYLPVVLGVLVLVALTIPQVQMSDRLRGGNFEAEEFATLLDNVPLEIGDWRGEDMPVEEQVRKTAGAVGYVSRAYVNSRTRDQVSLWLIVGHARDICRHTPEICYPSSGFRKRAENNSPYPFLYQGESGEMQGNFWTNTFVKEDVTGTQLVRVFWAWYDPQEGKILWEAPENPRWRFGNSRALHKMYFTAAMRDPKETTESSPCTLFAREVLPLIEQALDQERSAASPAGDRDAEPPASGESLDAPEASAT